MTQLEEKLFKGNDSWLNLGFGIFLGATGLFNLLREDPDTYWTWASLVGSVSLIAFFVGGRLAVRPIQWFALAAFAVFVVLASISIFVVR